MDCVCTRVGTTSHVTLLSHACTEHSTRLRHPSIFPHRTFTLVNLHLIHDGSNVLAAAATPSVFAQQRANMLALILRMVGADDRVPTLVAGDFNFRSMVSLPSCVSHHTHSLAQSLALTLSLSLSVSLSPSLSPPNLSDTHTNHTHGFHRCDLPAAMKALQGRISVVDPKRLRHDLAPEDTWALLRGFDRELHRFNLAHPGPSRCACVSTCF